jgi:hypothetical protein
LPGRRAQKIFVACRLEIRDTTGSGADRPSPKIDRPSAVRSL